MIVVVDEIDEGRVGRSRVRFRRFAQRCLRNGFGKAASGVYGKHEWSST